MKADKILNKKLHIELLRITAAFLVIVNHTNSVIFLNTQPSPLWFGSISYFFVSKAAVPVFVMIMGALLLEKQDSAKKYCSRIVRIAVVTVLFSLLHYAANGGGLSAKNVIRESLNSSAEPYWYLYLYLGLLLILPVMQKMAKFFTQRDVQLVILVSMVAGGIAPMLQYLGFRLHDAFFYGLLSPYIGMVFAGYYIEKYMSVTKKQAVAAVSAFVVLIAAQDILAFKAYNSHGGADYLWMDNAKFITISASAVCLYIAFKYICACGMPAKLQRAVKYLGSLTFGIYLMGDFFKMAFMPLYTSMEGIMPVMAAMIIYQFAIFAAAAAVTAVLKFIPFINKLI